MTYLAVGEHLKIGSIYLSESKHSDEKQLTDLLLVTGLSFSNGKIEKDMLIADVLAAQSDRWGDAKSKPALRIIERVLGVSTFTKTLVPIEDLPLYIHFKVLYPRYQELLETLKI